MQDRPTAVELLGAVREFLDQDVMPAVEGRVQFHTRVAVNALGMLERELRLGPELGLEAFTELDEQRALWRPTGEAAILVGNDACVVGLAEFGQCRVIRRRLGGGQSRTQRSDLYQLGVAELARDERGAILAEQVDRRGLADKNNRQQQKREPAEQRARPQRQSQAPSLGVAGSSGTNT